MRKLYGLFLIMLAVAAEGFNKSKPLSQQNYYNEKIHQAARETKKDNTAFLSECESALRTAIANNRQTFRGVGFTCWSKRAQWEKADTPQSVIAIAHCWNDDHPKYVCTLRKYQGRRIQPILAMIERTMTDMGVWGQGEKNRIFSEEDCEELAKNPQYKKQPSTTMVRSPKPLLISAH